MESKKDKKIEYRTGDKLSMLFIGLLYVSALMLASFTYRNPREIAGDIERYDGNTNLDYLYDSREKIPEPPKEVIPPKAKVSPPKELDLNNEVKPIDNQNDLDTNTLTTNIDNDLDISDTVVTIIDIDIPDDNKVFDFPDIEAEFPGGIQAWENYIINELVYPEISIELMEQGTVYLEFIIDIDGTVSSVLVIRGVSSYIDKEAKRVIKNSPKWIPAKVGNYSVRSRLSIPLNFVIQ